MAAGDKLFFNGTILSLDSRIQGAEAVAVREGQILTAGSQSHCRASLSANPEEVDLKGQTLLPGFIDTHIHPTLMLFYELYEDFSGVKSLEATQARIRQCCGPVSAAGWMLGLQFEEQYFNVPVVPTRHDLDNACSDRPVVLLKRDGHSLIANTLAIKTAGVSSETRVPDGGSIEREGDGFPSGVFKEKAMDLVLSAMPLPEMERIVHAARSVFKRITGFGVTSAGAILQTDEDGPLGERGAFDLPLLEMVIEQIPISLYSLLVAKDVDKILEAQKGPFHQDFQNCSHRIGAVKIWADGSFSSQTARMFEPFADAPGNRGYMVHSREVLYQRMLAPHLAGLQLAVHSIGDESTQIVLELFDRLLREHPRENHRHRIEHLSIIHPPQTKQLADLQLIPSVQPMFIHSEKDWLENRLGSERLASVYPFRSLLDSGVVLAGSSDAPIETMDVMHAVGCCVTREGFEEQQCISVEEALRMFTLGSARAQFEETVKGSITPGKRADFVLLAGDPTRVDPGEIKDITVEKTYCAGDPV